MTLTDGSGYSVSGTSCYKTASNGVTSWAYNSTNQPLTAVTMKWYYNGTLIHTNTGTSTVSNLYPKVSSYYQDSNKVFNISTTATSITWTLSGSGFPGADTVAVMGADDTTTGSGFYDMRFAFYVDGSSKLTALKEDGVLVSAQSGHNAVTAGDEFKLDWSATPTTSTVTIPPPVAMVNI